MVGVLDITAKTDEELAADAAREDSDGPAFAELVQRHQERVWRICHRLLDDDSDAGDAAQETFVGLFLGRASFAGRSKFSTWLHSIAVRTCLKLRRARGRRRRREMEMTETTANEADAPTAAPAGLALDLAQMLETLDEEDRAILILKYAEDYSYEELAELFHLSQSACKMRVSRARDELQRRFPDERF